MVGATAIDSDSTPQTICLCPHLRQDCVGSCEERLAAEAARLQEAASRSPHCAATWRELSKIQEQRRLYQAACEAHKRVVDIEPANVCALVELGWLLRQCGHAAGSVAVYKQVLVIDETYAEAHRGLICALAKIDDVEGAVKACQVALKLVTPTHERAVLWARLGALYLARQEHGAAEEAFREGLREDPTCGSAWTGVASALGSQDKPEEAFEMCRQGIEAVRTDAERGALWHTLGELQKKHDPESSKHALEMASELIPECNRTRLLLARKAAAEGDLRRAIELVESAIALEPKNPQWQVELGKLQERMGDPRACLVAFQIALKLLFAQAANVSNVTSWCDCGKYFQDAKDFETAYLCFQNAATVDPRSARAWGFLAYLTLTVKGDPVAARPMFDKALELDPAAPGPLRGMGALLYKTAKTERDYEESRTTLQAAVEMEPENPHGHWFLGLVCMKLKMWEQAEKQFMILVERGVDYVRPAQRHLTEVRKNMRAWGGSGGTVGAWRTRRSWGSEDCASSSNESYDDGSIVAATRGSDAVSWVGKHEEGVMQSCSKADSSRINLLHASCHHTSHSTTTKTATTTDVAGFGGNPSRAGAYRPPHRR